jgi:hypothetical protein
MNPREIHRTPTFQRDLKQLAKKHRSLPADVDTLLTAIATAQLPLGDRIPGVRGLPVFKDRVALGNKGASGGARLIYYCAENLVVALALYAKNDMANMQANTIYEALKDAGLVPEEPPAS